MKRLTATAVLAGAALGASAGLALGKEPSPGIDTAASALITSKPAPAQGEQQPLPPIGKKMGRFKLTYYWMAAETGGQRRVQLYNKRCRPVARVSSSFARRLRLEGGGKLRDGRVLTYSGACGCGPSLCIGIARRGHTWGTGVNGRPLSPFRSVAVDPRHVAIGTSLYIPELDGVAMPGKAPWGGFVHDGCVVADDQGGGIRGRQLDLFAARKFHYKALDRRHRLKRVTVFAGGERCQSLTHRPSGRPGSS